MPTRSYDAIIVGSGPTGGYAAKALTEAGLHVLVLEAGATTVFNDARLAVMAVRRRFGYRIEHDPAAIRRQRIQSSCYAWPIHPHAFVDDIDNPYTTDGDRPFAWIRCRQVGGRMLVRRHGLQFYRFSDFDFKAGERDGASASWPISYADVAPYYERIERWMKLRGTIDGLPQLPDSVIAARVEPHRCLTVLKDAIERRWKERHVIAGRTARPPVPIRDALTTGRCSLKSMTIATQVVIDTRRPKATGVRFVNAVTGRAAEASARTVILCASTIESTRLLLASATREHPNGLANSSGALGHYLMDHTHLSGIRGDLPSHAVDDDSARWAYIPRFRNVCGSAAAFARGYGIQVFTKGNQIGLTVFGEMLPHPGNRVTLAPRVKDKWGVPAVHITCVNRDNETAMAADAVQECCEMLDAAKIHIWGLNSDLSTPGLAVHEVGTARMGADPRTSVLNGFCQSWDIDNLFVMDGSCFVTQGVQNPTLTMLALAARSCDYLLESMRRGEL